MSIANGMIGYTRLHTKGTSVSTGSSIRLNKFISDSGHCSRREADKLIDANRVKVNGRRPELGTRVEAGDVVTVDGQEVVGSVPDKSDRIYLAYNKPVGITCTTQTSVKGNIVDAIDHDERIFPIGRLDKPSEGLILLTSDGDIVNKILRAENAHEKEYLVTVNKSIGSDFASKMSRGIPILDTITKPCKVSVVGRSAFKITLTQGLNRQIRRMCEYLGYEVTQLVRLRIMNVALGKLKPGQWRNLNQHEMEQLNSAIAASKGESSRSSGQSPKKKRKPHQHKHPARNDSAPARKSSRKPKPGKPARGGQGKSDARRNQSKSGKPGASAKQPRSGKPRSSGAKKSAPGPRRRK